MPELDYHEFGALDPFFAIIKRGLAGYADGDHFFDLLSEDAIFEFRYRFPGWPEIVHGRSALMDLFRLYGDGIRLESADQLVVHRGQDPALVVLEYEVHGVSQRSGRTYNNRFASIVRVKDGKVVSWRDYMDSLAPYLLSVESV